MKAVQTANFVLLIEHCSLDKGEKHNEKGKKHLRLIACQYKWKLITWISEIRSKWFVFQCGINMFEGADQMFGNSLCAGFRALRILATN